MTRFTGLLILLFALLSVHPVLAQEKLSPYVLLDMKPGAEFDSLKARIPRLVRDSKFEVLGMYHPGGNPDLWVLVYTSPSIKGLALKSKDRGLLAAPQRIGLFREGNQVEVSAVNPNYLFTAYFGKKLKSEMGPVVSEIKALWKTIGNGQKSFGGSVSIGDLEHYHYMFGMPYFEDPVELKTFTSFEEGMKLIEKNLAAKTGNTVKVYSLVDQASQTAVWGVGLNHKETGEDHFLSIIGKKHVAAMPYEIILTGKKLTMLHGRFRFALYWPELTMGTFTKIMSTPGDVEETMKGLTK